MDQYESIRTLSRVYDKSIREISRQTGHHRKTVRKALAGLEPKYRRKKPPTSPVMGLVAKIVAGWLQGDRNEPRNQRHTAHRIYERLVLEHGFGGGESTVRRWVRDYKARQGWGRSQAVVPLDPEAAREAEVDWGSAVVQMSGERRRVRLFCMRSRYWGKAYVRAYPWERQEMFLDAHMRAFAFYGGVFETIVYDNLSTAVEKILKGKTRLENQRFHSFGSYYTFRARFCNPALGREKGGVEGLVGLARRNILVPIPKVKSFSQLNRLLQRRCVEFGTRHIGGREDRRTIDQRHAQEQARLLSLPQSPFENSKQVQVRISAYQTAQVDRNRYSVPGAWVGRQVMAHLGCQRVSFYAAGEKIAQHERVFSNSKWQLDPLHYLELIGQRVGAFEAARPIRQWREHWPGDYEVMLEGLRRRQGGNRGTREFVRILQLHAHWPKRQVQSAISEAVRRQVFSLEAVKQLLALEETTIQAEPLGADVLPGITDRQVALPDLDGYDGLLSGGVR